MTNSTGSKDRVLDQTLQAVKHINNLEDSDSNLNLRFEVLMILQEFFLMFPEQINYFKPIIEACYLKDIEIIKELQEILTRVSSIFLKLNDTDNSHKKQIIICAFRQAKSIINPENTFYTIASLHHPFFGYCHDFNEVFLGDNGIRRLALYYNKKYKIDIRIRIRMNEEFSVSLFFQEIDAIIEEYFRTKIPKKVAFIINGNHGHVMAFILSCESSGMNLFLFDSTGLPPQDSPELLLSSKDKSLIEEKINHYENIIRYLISNPLDSSNLTNEQYDQIVEKSRTTLAPKDYVESFLKFWLCSKRRGIPLIFFEDCMQADNRSCRVITLGCVKQILLNKNFLKDIIITEHPSTSSEEKVLTFCGPLSLLKYSQRSSFNQYVLDSFQKAKHPGSENFEPMPKQAAFFFSKNRVTEKSLFTKVNEKGLDYVEKLEHSMC